MRESHANLNTRTYLAIFLIATSIGVATTSIATPVLAAKDPDPARGGLDKADENVHDHLGTGTEGDVRFHEGLCQGGHSTTVLDSIGGCDNPIITDPGKSDDHRQDK